MVGNEAPAPGLASKCRRPPRRPIPPKGAAWPRPLARSPVTFHDPAGIVGWFPVAASGLICGGRRHGGGVKGGSCPAVLSGCGSAGPELGRDLGAAQKLADPAAVLLVVA